MSGGRAYCPDNDLPTVPSPRKPDIREGQYNPGNGVAHVAAFSANHNRGSFISDVSELHAAVTLDRTSDEYLNTSRDSAASSILPAAITPLKAATGHFIKTEPIVLWNLSSAADRHYVAIAGADNYRRHHGRRDGIVNVPNTELKYFPRLLLVEDDSAKASAFLTLSSPSSNPNPPVTALLMLRSGKPVSHDTA